MCIRDRFYRGSPTSSPYAVRPSRLLAIYLNPRQNFPSVLQDCYSLRDRNSTFSTRTLSLLPFNGLFWDTVHRVSKSTAHAFPFYLKFFVTLFLVCPCRHLSACDVAWPENVRFSSSTPVHEDLNFHANRFCNFPIAYRLTDFFSKY